MKPSKKLFLQKYKKCTIVNVAFCQFNGIYEKFCNYYSKMALEIEHKYLVINDSFKDLSSKCIHICQGYLSKDKERTVRIRIAGKEAFITIKGKNSGDTRLEFEYPISIDEARIMLEQLCHKPILEKYRYIVEYNCNKWEIDEFKGELDGLILAEIEIPYSEYKYDIPPFIGKNVTNDVRYYNSNLIDKIPKD